MTNQSWDFFRFRLRTQLWLMTPWEGLPNHSKATMNLCRHTRYLRISHCRTVRREFSKSFRYIPCVSLQISASSSCFLLPTEWSTAAGLQWTTMPWGILYRRGTLMDLNLMHLLIGLFLAWSDHVWIYGDVWYAYIHLVIRQVLMPCPVAAESPKVCKIFCFQIPHPTWHSSLIWLRNKNPAPAFFKTSRPLTAPRPGAGLGTVQLCGGSHAALGTQADGRSTDDIPIVMI